MVRWIAFDDETAEAVVSRFKRGAAEIEHGDPLTLALESERPTVLILPSETPDKAMLAKVSPTPGLITYEATGFLGLTDTPIVKRQSAHEVRDKASWWKKLFGH